MSSAMVRLLACLLMAVDHLGALFFPDEILFRAVGRLAFPLFAFLIAEGCRFTKSREAYLSRLMLLGLLSQIPFYLAFHDEKIYCNVIYTLALGALSVFVFDKWRFWGLMAFMAIAEIFHCDYGAVGVFSVFAFWYVSGKQPALGATFIAVGFLLGIRNGLVAFSQGRDFRINLLLGMFAVLAAAVSTMYESKRGWKGRGFFYAFYPVHLLIFATIKYLV